jgi:hypothetical protein
MFLKSTEVAPRKVHKEVARVAGSENLHVESGHSGHPGHLS